MKKNYCLLSMLTVVALTLCAFIVSCGDDDPTPELKLSDTFIQLQANGDGNKSISVTAVATDWSISIIEGSAWLNAYKSGEGITISVSENKETESRNGRLKVVATADASLNYDVIVTQAGLKPTLDVDVKELKFSVEGESRSLRITSNTSWQISDIPGWLTVSPASESNSKVVVVQAHTNNEINKRNATLKISTENGGIQKTIFVEQEGVVESISTDVSEIKIGAEAGSIASINVSSNSDWVVAGVPEWLRLSATSGSKNSNITLTTLSENSKASVRSATLKFSTTTKSCNVSVQQEPSLAGNCDVKPNIIVTLHDGVAFDFIFGKDVKYYYVRAYNPSYLSRMTDKEIIEEMSSDPSNRDTPSDSYVTSWQDLPSSTDITFCTIGFNSEGKHGELIKTNISTPRSYNQAVAAITDAGVVSDGEGVLYWTWTTSPNGFCTKYYQWFVSRTDLYTATNAAVAWFMKQEMANYPDDFPPINLSDTWYKPISGGKYFHVVTWAVNSEGKFAGDIGRERGSLNSSSGKIKKYIEAGNDSNPLLKRYKTYK